MQQHLWHQQLEDIKARLLAADPTDAGTFRLLQAQIEQSVAGDEGSAHIFRPVILSFENVRGDGKVDITAILDAVATAISSIMNDIAATAEQSASDLLDASDAISEFVLQAAPSAEQEPAASAGNASPELSAALAIDPDLLKEFIAEAHERIASAEAALLSLEKNPHDAEQINIVLRAFHTIKGAAAFLGLTAVQELAHQAENLLTQAREGRIEMRGRNADLALRAGDLLKQMVDNLTGGPEPDPADVARISEELAQPGLTDEAEQRPQPAPQADIALPPADAAAQKNADAAAKNADADLTVRVSTERLDHLVNMVGELAISHSIIAQRTAETTDSALANDIRSASKIVRDLQALAMGLRMTPLKPTFHKMARLVRDLAQKSGKAIEFTTAGEDTEIDRNMVETISDPLIHMMRNAIDHGIEPAAERIVAGKPETAVVQLKAYHSAGSVVIELSDDGRGLDRGRIIEKAQLLGLVSNATRLADKDIDALIFHPGLSTASRVTDVSGRGVGMDVVKRNIESLHGRVDLISTPGQGTTFTISLPLTMALMEAMLVRVGRERYLLPTVSIERSFQPKQGEVQTVAGRAEMVRNRDAMIPVCRLARLFRLDGAAEEPTSALLVVVEGRPGKAALMVDELLGHRQVVVKSLGGMLARSPGLSGAAILGDGQPGLILDAAGLVQLAQTAN